MKKTKKTNELTPTVGSLYKIRANNNYVESSLEFWKQTSGEDYESFTFVKDDPTALFLSDIIKVPINAERPTRIYEEILGQHGLHEKKKLAENPAFSNEIWRGMKHSFVFLVGDKKIVTTPFYAPLFYLFFENQNFLKSV